MSNQYDVIMIGAGPSAIFCAYELKRNKPDMKVLMIEKGRRIEKRACPKRNTKVCVSMSYFLQIPLNHSDPSRPTAATISSAVYVSPLSVTTPFATPSSMMISLTIVSKIISTPSFNKGS